jgi:glutaminyl-peptide cyclotransferase
MRIAPGIVLLLLASALGASCRRDSVPPQETGVRAALDPRALKGETALEEARNFVALGPRDAGTAGAARAAQYLAERLRTMSIDPLVDRFERLTPAGPIIFRNVAGVIPGKRNVTVILGSHYDTKSGIADTFAGANDSGSSTGLLLALADQLRQAAPLPLEVLVVFFDGEECRRSYGPGDGLHGSRRLAQTLVRNQRVGRTRAMILLDMVGDRDLKVTIPRNSTPALVTLAFESARALGMRNRFSLAKGNVLDDHVPFLEAGIPAVNLIDFEYGSKPGLNDHWHTPNDTIDKLSAGSLEAVGQVVIEMLNRLSSQPDPEALKAGR